MNSEPLVSVVIPSYNIEKFIIDALESVKKQTYQNFEVIVVDDGSTDGTKDLIRQFLSDQRFKLIEQKNSGPAAARNLGVCHSKGEFIAFLDGDDEWVPDKLQKQLGMFRSDPTLDIVGTNYSFMEEDGQNMGRDRYVSFPNGFKENPKLALLNGCGISTITVMMRKEYFERVEGFDRTLRYGEDYDLWMKIVQSGGKLAFMMDPLSRRRCRAGSLQHNALLAAETGIRVFGKALAREKTRVGRKMLKHSLRKTKSAAFSTKAVFDMPEKPISASIKLIKAWLCYPKRLRVLIWGMGLLIPLPSTRRKIHASMKTKLWHGGISATSS